MADGMSAATFYRIPQAYEDQALRQAGLRHVWKAAERARFDVLEREAGAFFMAALSGANVLHLAADYANRVLHWRRVVDDYATRARIALNG